MVIPVLAAALLSQASLKSVAESLLAPRPIGSPAYAQGEQRVRAAFAEAGGTPFDLAPASLIITQGVAKSSSLSVGQVSIDGTQGLVFERPTDNATLTGEAVLVKARGDKPGLANFRVLNRKIVLLVGPLTARSFRNQVFGADPLAVIVATKDTPAPDSGLVEALGTQPVRRIPQGHISQAALAQLLTAAGYQGGLATDRLTTNKATVEPLSGAWKLGVGVKREPLLVDIPAARFGPPGKPILIAVGLDGTGEAAHALSLSAFLRATNGLKNSKVPVIFAAIPGVNSRLSVMGPLLTKWPGEPPKGFIGIEGLGGDSVVNLSSGGPDDTMLKELVKASSRLGISPVIARDGRTNRTMSFRVGSLRVPAATILGEIPEEEDSVPEMVITDANVRQAEQASDLLAAYLGIRN